MTDAAEEEPVGGVSASLDRYIITRFSDEDGNYVFDDLPIGNYAVTFTANDYLPATEEINTEDGDAERDVALLHSRCIPTPEGIVHALEPDLTQELNLTIENTGNGPLTYLTERHFVGDVDDPWTIRFEVAAQDDLGALNFAEVHELVEAPRMEEVGGPSELVLDNGKKGWVGGLSLWVSKTP